jgi:long-chain acyl-CoA synthetase
VFSTLRTFRDDLTAHPPDHFVCVPLVLDTLYNKVRGEMM